MSSAQIYPSEKLDLLFKSSMVVYPKRTGKEHRTKKSFKCLNIWIFPFLNDILWQEKSFNFFFGESSG